MDKPHSVCTYLRHGNELLLIVVKRSSKSTLKLMRLIWHHYPLSHYIFINYIFPSPTVNNLRSYIQWGIYTFPALLLFEKARKLLNIQDGPKASYPYFCVTAILATCIYNLPGRSDFENMQRLTVVVFLLTVYY